MKRTLSALALAASLALCAPVHAQEPVPINPCHGYEATAHTDGRPLGSFSLSVCRADDDEAIDEAIGLAMRITGDPRYIETVTVVYHP